VRRRIAIVAFTFVLASARGAAADDAGGYPQTPGSAPVRVSADRIELDAETQKLVLRGDVELDSGPFHLTSEELRLSRSGRGVVVEGSGRIAFCPCLAQPLAVAFKGATIAPPGDLFVDQPTLEVFHVPVMWLPFFWLRSPGRVGLLAPDIAYRGQDGMFLGEGVHLPWRPGDTQSGLDLRAGAYLKGGVATEATLKTPDTVTTFRWDHLQDATTTATPDAVDGFAADSRGALGPGAGLGKPSLAWDVDALRGTRGVVSTTDVDAASRVFDRESAEVSLQGGGWTVATALRMTTLRGSAIGDFGAAGPVVSARRDGTVGDVGAYDARVEAGALTGDSLATTSFGRAGAGVLLASHAGPFRATWSLRAAGDVAASGPSSGFDGAAQGRLELALPLARTFESSEPNDPWRHRIEPLVEAVALGTSLQNLVIDSPTADSLSGVAWIADGGVATALGRWATREGIEVRASAGAAGSDAENAVAVVRWRAAASFPWLGLGAEGAHVLGGEALVVTEGAPSVPPLPGAPLSEPGYAVAARLRVGPLSSLHLGVSVAGREGVDPVLARALTDAPLPATMGFLAADGWTGGTRLSVPLTAYLTARGGADADLTAKTLLAARGALEFHDRCGCVVITANGAERIGRPGVDVWLTVGLVRR
jgi:hypothetical protein